MTEHQRAHPGEGLLEDMIKPLGLSITDAAKHLGISRKTLSLVVNGHASITADMAIRINKCFGGPSAGFWLRLQAAYDLWQAEQHSDDLKVTPVQERSA
ncbi:MAG: HigA family addiction module antitoxin [Candidatus Aquicultorales bacterium]